MLHRLIVATLMMLSLTGTAQACAKPGNAAALQAGMVDWINQQRQAKGLNRLTASGKLKAAAQGHACDMAGRGYFSHQRAGGPDIRARLKSNGYRFRTAAENIAKSQRKTVDAAAELWRNSPDHWANILKPDVTEIGIGLAETTSHYYWVMNVGKSR